MKDFSGRKIYFWNVNILFCAIFVKNIHQKYSKKYPGLQHKQSMNDLNYSLQQIYTYRFRLCLIFWQLDFMFIKTELRLFESNKWNRISYTEKWNLTFTTYSLLNFNWAKLECRLDCRKHTCACGESGGV